MTDHNNKTIIIVAIFGYLSNDGYVFSFFSGDNDDDDYHFVGVFF